MMEIDVNIRKTLVDRGRRFTLEARFSSVDEFVVLFGPSGSGKSLTLQAVAGLLRPDDGVIRVGSRILFDKRRGIDVATRDRRIGYLFQDYALFPHLSAAENIASGLRCLWQWRLPRGQRRRVQEMLDVFELGDVADALPRDLSGGQRQRVALARALAREPDILLLDEPFAALNPLLRAKMRKELARIQTHFAVPVLLITHDEADVREFGDTLLLYDAGRVASAWPFKKLLAEPQGAGGNLNEVLAALGTGSAMASAARGLPVCSAP